MYMYIYGHITYHILMCQCDAHEMRARSVKRECLLGTQKRRYAVVHVINTTQTH